MKRFSQQIGVLAVVFVAACQSWRVSDVSPASLVADEHPRVVRVDETAGGRLELKGPAVRGDTLYGRAGGTIRAVPLGDIASISVKYGDTGKSLLLTLGILAGAFAAIAVVAIASVGGGCC